MLSDISFAYVNEIYPNRIYFEVTQPITAPAAYDLAHWNFGTISGNYWVGDCSFNTKDTSAVLINDNKGEWGTIPQMSTKFYLQTDSGQFQYEKTRVTRNRNFTSTGHDVSQGWTKSAGKLSTNTFGISNNVITPYYENSGNTFMGPSGNSIYIWFKGRDGSAVDICGEIDLCRNYFKIVTKGYTKGHKGDSDTSYNILDVSEVTVVNIPKYEAGNEKPEREVSGIKIDLSRNPGGDLSNVTTPCTFSQYDNVYVWWDSKAAYKNDPTDPTKILQDTSGNPIWDASAQGFTGTNRGQHPDISGLIDGSSTRIIPFTGDWSPTTFFGLGVSNNVVDISGISGEIYGTVEYHHIGDWSNVLMPLGNDPAHIKIWTNETKLDLPS